MKISYRNIGVWVTNNTWLLSKKPYMLILFVFFSSCSENFLDKNPQGVVFDENLANPEGIEGLLIGAYGSLHGTAVWELGSPGSNWLFGSVYADDAYVGSIESDQPPMNNIERYDLHAGNDYYSTRWLTLYDGIARCNHTIRIINMALENQTISENEGTQYKAEALFLRAYFHLEAIKMWDFIPYSDELHTDGLAENFPPDNVEPNAGDTPWGELSEGIPWERVEEDLLFAIENLDYDPGDGAVGRATKYKAMALKARIKMYQGKYNEAAPILNEIMASGRYNLMHDYRDNFRTSGDNREEAIFQIQYSVNDGAEGMLGNAGDVANHPIYPGPMGCCGFFQPSQNLVNAFKTKYGLPYLKAFGLDFNEVGDDVKNDMGIESDDPFYIPDTRELDPRLDWTVGRRGIPYLDWGDHPGKTWIRDQYWGGPYSPIKNGYYQSEEDKFVETTGWMAGLNNANNYSIIRYADILLMAAECAVAANQLDEARELVNQVRARARDGAWVLQNGAMDDGSHIGSNGETPAANYLIREYPDDGGPLDAFTIQEAAWEAVQFERRLELGMEGHRFWDLKRWGNAKTTLNDYVDKESHMHFLLDGAVFEDKHIRHPIPQQQIEISNPYLKQNPGY
jgi:hypothetical protein